MCPIFRATHEEAATPRAKANLMRHLLQPGADPRLLSSDEVRAVADLCVNCKMCADECPAHVNVPKLMLQVKAANVAEHGLDRTDWAMARTESFAGLGSAFAPLANAAAGESRWPAGCSKSCSACRAAAVCRPSPSGVSCASASRRGWTRKPRSARPRVAYFVDIFANYNDPLIAEAVVAVLHHNGIEVYVPAAPGRLRHGAAGLRRPGDRPRNRAGEPAHPRRPGPRGLSDPLLGADRRRDAAARRPRSPRRPRRPPGGRADGRIHGVSVGPASAGQSAHRLPAAAVRRRSSCAVPSESAGPAAGGSGAVVA